MNKYELALVLSAKLEEEERAAALEKAKSYITRFGGTITNVDEWGKKRLAYEIQKMKEGFYYFIQFESDSNCPNEVESHVRIMEPVIRYLCVRQDA
ncbi:30S ribosomal protein S6 [Fusibacillus kribbianus]|uniref:Small ribosomal subunit protein bS6 n=1 Tax=Fusibacillus kribbianus TaxID=3044208 RepID=A0AAP4EXL1_9FIRM|nr:30S ribosomal protein S6 [Ruminococcus sp. YH-rum2234]MDI9241932.1 30S ribosomal protein S6 [Ruminococcus sp. YH-rum2234]